MILRYHGGFYELLLSVGDTYSLRSCTLDAFGGRPSAVLIPLLSVISILLFTVLLKLNGLIDEGLNAPKQLRLGHELQYMASN